MQSIEHKDLLQSKFDSASENYLLRRGDILNPIGVFRAAMANKGVLQKKHYIDLVRKNYLIDSNQAISESIENRINIVWIESKKFLSCIKILEEHSDEKIVISDPTIDIVI